MTENEGWEIFRFRVCLFTSCSEMVKLKITAFFGLYMKWIIGLDRASLSVYMYNVAGSSYPTTTCLSFPENENGEMYFISSFYYILYFLIWME